MAYATVSELKAYLGVGSDADDALLASLLERATAAVDAYTRRWFADVDETRLYSAESVEATTLHLDAPLLEATQITIDGVVADLNGCALLPRNGPRYYAIMRLAGWRGSVIAVTGLWGWSTTPPADIVHATVRWAGYMYRQRDAQVFDVTALPDSGVITVPAGIPSDVRVLLEPYRSVL